jgi:hypothetical protein
LDKKEGEIVEHEPYLEEANGLYISFEKPQEVDTASAPY